MLKLLKNIKIQKYMIFDEEHGFIAQALSWGTAKRKIKKYKKTNNHGNIIITTKYGSAIKLRKDK